MPTHCYVKVFDGNNGKGYDIGPFANSGNDLFSSNDSAINWIYKQIGLIKVNHPDTPLIKHKWLYMKDEFLDVSADVKVEIQNITFEIFNLISPSHNVIDELTSCEYPDWVKSED